MNGQRAEGYYRKDKNHGNIKEASRFREGGCEYSEEGGRLTEISGRHPGECRTQSLTGGEESQSTLEQGRFTQEEGREIVARMTQLKSTQKIHRRRSEDEMRKALQVVEAKHEHLLINRDDEHPEVIYDAITELLETRPILALLLQSVSMATQAALTSIKQLDQQ